MRRCKNSEGGPTVVDPFCFAVVRGGSSTSSGTICRAIDHRSPPTNNRNPEPDPPEGKHLAFPHEQS